MPRNWNVAADASDKIYIADDFKRAMYQLVSLQCLYSRFVHHSTSYRIISSYREEFEEAISLMGLRLEFNDRLEFCFVIPEIVKDTPLDQQETLFLLVLRQLYHIKGSAGDLDRDGDAVITIDELISTYRSVTNRDLESKSENIRRLVKVASRKGLAKIYEKPENDPQPFAIIILPGIAEILSEHVVGRFGAYLKSGLISNTADIELEIEENSNENA